MNPQGPERPTPHAGGMVQPDEDDPALLAAFNEQVEAWLADETTPPPVDESVRHPAGTALQAMFAALAEARSHDTCPKDTERTVDIIVQVVGVDLIYTIQRIPPGVNPGCVLRALVEDQRTAIVRVLGWARHSDPLPEPEWSVTEAGGMQVTSEVPEMVVTYDGDLDGDPDEHEPDLSTEHYSLAPLIYAVGVVAVILVALALVLGL